MLIVDTVLGNTSDKQWHERAAKAKVDYLALDQWDAQKNRLRRKTEQGNDVAISLPRNTFLHNGDVLAFDEANNSMIVAKISLRDVLIIEIKELLKKDQLPGDDHFSALFGTMIETRNQLGHLDAVAVRVGLIALTSLHMLSM